MKAIITKTVTINEEGCSNVFTKEMKTVILLFGIPLYRTNMLICKR